MAFDVAATSPFKALLKKRRAEGQRILLEEVAAGHALASPHEAEAAVAMTLRYLRAVDEGTARRNLRLLAQVMQGQLAQSAIYADEFLQWADLIAGLRREEVVLLGAMVNAEEAETAAGTDRENLAGRAMKRVSAELVGDGRLFASGAELAESCAAVTRTGLVVPVSLYGALGYRTTPRMRTLARLTQWDRAAAE